MRNLGLVAVTFMLRFLCGSVGDRSMVYARALNGGSLTGGPPVRVV
jgi:hypothetical protein